jgi:methionyl-tRNA synthetase
MRKTFFILNRYIDHSAPWNIKTDPQLKRQVLGTIVVMIRAMMFVLEPFVPIEIEELVHFVGEPLRTIPRDIHVHV